MKLRIAIALACLAAVLIAQLAIPPIVGLADQGDFARVIGKFGYGPVAPSAMNERYYYFVNRLYAPDNHFRLPNWEAPTSEYLLTGAAVGLNALFGRKELLDLRVMGAVHMAVLLAAVWLLLWGAARMARTGVQIALAVAVVFILGDTAYAVYLNSFYTEAATLLFLALTIAAWLHVIAGSRSAAVLAALGVAMVLFLWAKPQNIVTAPVLGLAFARFWPEVRGRGQRAALAVVLATIAGAATWIYRSTPPVYPLCTSYDAVFLGILPVSPDPDADLRWFGLQPELKEYIGTGALGAKTALHVNGFAAEFQKRVTWPRLARYYAMHPARTLAHIRTVLPAALSLRPEFCGNLEKATVLARFGEGARENGNGALARSYAFAMWSRLHEQYLNAAWVLALLAASIPFALVIGYRSGRPRLFEMYAALALAAILSFFAAVLADAWDNVKHLFLFNVLLDACIVMAAMWLTAIGLRRLEKVPGRARAGAS